MRIKIEISRGWDKGHVAIYQLHCGPQMQLMLNNFLGGGTKVMLPYISEIMGPECS